MAGAEQTTVEAVAGRLLRFSLDRTRFKPGEVAELLDPIPGFHERYQESLAQARAGRTRGASHPDRRDRPYAAFASVPPRKSCGATRA